MYVTATGRTLSFSAASNSYPVAGAQTSLRYGTAKNDAMYSNWGETLAGGLGDDSYYLWQPGATVSENGGEGIDTVYVQYWGGYALTANVENVVLKSIGANWATGNALDNILVAGVTGARLDGGAGNDVLVGGAGADTFSITKGNGSDAIYGFQAGWDTVSLNNYGFASWTELSSRMRQTGSDVTVDLGNGETLVLRDTALSKLGATDFGFAVEKATATLAAKGFAALEKAANVQFANGWYALNNTWGSNGLVEGKDYWVSTAANQSSLTSGTRFSWSYPGSTAMNQQVLAYPAISFGVSPHAPTANTSVLFPIKVGDIKGLTANYDVSFGGTTSGFNVSFDIWFTSQPRGDASTVTNEVMIWLHSGTMTPSGTVVGTYAKNGFSATIYRSGTYTAIVADKDSPVGSLDLADIMSKLKDLGILKSGEYLSSIELGSEVTSGSGSLTVNNLDLKVDQVGADGKTVTSIVTGKGVETLNPTVTDFAFVAGVSQSASVVGATDHDHLIVDFSGLKHGVTVDASKADGSIAIDSGTISYQSIEHVALTGTAYDDVLIGGDGDDVLIGGAGNDTLRGGLGTNILNGGAGDDRYVIMSSTDTIIDSSGNDFVTTYANYAIHLGIETVGIATGGLTVTGNAEANTVWGSSGRDVIYGMGGNDYIGAKEGNDQVSGGDGDDTIFGDAGDDAMFGDAGNDYLYGGDGNDALYGGDGSDRLNGGAGADLLVGGAGDDFYMITDALNTIIENTNGGTDTVTATISYTLGANLENLALQGSKGLTGTGNALANIITGDSGADRLYGMDGNDTLIGRGGADDLYGGAGADRFFYENVSDSTRAAQDTIWDFNYAQGDRITLTKIDANIWTAADDAFSFIGNRAFSHTAGELRYSVVGGNAVIEGDVNGDGIADLSILLKGIATVSAAYFQL